VIEIAAGRPQARIVLLSQADGDGQPGARGSQRLR
jgi:hypothetical protein